MERNHRRLPAPGVEEALSSMLWTPYPRTPSETSDDDDPEPIHSAASVVSKSYHQRLHTSSIAHNPVHQPQQQATRFARLTRPLSFMDKRKSCANTNRDPPHLYPEPIRYFSAAEAQPQPHQRQHYIRQSASAADALSAASSSSSGRQRAQLPSYELVEQERLHHSLNSLATAATNGTSGIYFIAPYSRYEPSGGSFINGVSSGVGTALVNSFTDDFAQYQVSYHANHVVLSALYA